MGKLEKIVVATRNLGKKERFQRFLNKIAKKVLSLDDFNFTGKPNESGETAEENAKIKALFYAEKLNLPVFSEDESLFVDFLPENQQPGTHVRRVNGKELNDKELLAYWASITANVPKDKMTGRWHIAYCFVMPSQKPILISIDHPIIFFNIPSGTVPSDWPMNSIQGPAKFGKPESELTPEELKKHEQDTETILVQRLDELFQIH